MAQDNRLYIFCGIPFSGKSTLTKTLADRKGFDRIDLDEIKFELYDSEIEDKDLVQEDWDVIYQEMYARIERSLKAGHTVVHDTGNFTRYERDLVRKIGEDLELDVTTVYVDTQIETARERLVSNRRLRQRFNVTDEEFEDAVKEMEPPGNLEPHIVFESGESVDSWIAKYFD